MTLNEFLSNLKKVKKNRNGWLAQCPAHDDKEPSLSIKEGNKRRIIFYCYAGCSFASICAALDIQPKELSNNNTTQQKQIVAVYDYKSESGELLFQVVRYAPKDFRQRKSDGQGGWIYRLGDVRRVLYRLPELVKANQGSIVFVTEGEKGVEELFSLGLFATCSVSGAGKWRDDYNESLRGFQVVILSDNDEPGRKHAEQVAQSLYGTAQSVRVIHLPNLPVKGDVSDWLDAENSKEDLLSIVESSPLWKPNQNTSETKKDETALRVVCLAEVQPEQVSWLWHPYVPVGKLTLLDGEEGIGKSWLLCAIAGRISQGECLPFSDEAIKGKVLLLSGSEDGLGDTIRPRLDSAGADCKNIFAVDEPFTFDEKGLIKLSSLIAELKPSLVVIDPLFDYVTAKTDINTDNQSRAVTKPLREIAERFKCAIVAVRHIGKAKGNGEARAAGLGGIGFRAAGRSGLLVGCDPQDRTKRAMILTKSNLANKDAAKAVGFTIENGKFYWLGESPLTAEKILSKLENEDEREEQNEAVAFLRETLRDGAKPFKDLMSEAKQYGFSEKRLQRAASKLKVVRKREGFGLGSSWSLPSIPDIQEHLRPDKKECLERPEWTNNVLNGTKEEKTWSSIQDTTSLIQDVQDTSKSSILNGLNGEKNMLIKFMSEEREVFLV